MNHIVLLFALFFVLSIAVPAIVRSFRGGPRARARSIVEYAQRRGYVLVNPAVGQALDASRLEMARDPALRQLIKASADISDIEGLERGTEDWLAFTCPAGGKEATVFNFSVSSQRADTVGGSIQYKVAKIRAPGLPQFSLGRNSAVHTVRAVVDTVVGNPKTDIKLDPAAHPGFSARYWLRGSDLAAVTQFLSPAKTEFIEAAKLEGIVATNARYLVYFEDGVLGNETDFDSFIGKIEQVAANLL